MTDREKTRETMAAAAELRRATEEVFVDSMRTELAVIRTMCTLAEPEEGEKRAHHVQQAEKAFASALEIAKRFGLNQSDRDAIEEARYSICRLGGRDFSQPRD